MKASNYALLPLFERERDQQSRRSAARSPSRAGPGAVRQLHSLAHSLRQLLTTRRGLVLTAAGILTLFLVISAFTHPSSPLSSASKTPADKVRYVGSLQSTVCGTRRSPDAADLPAVEYGLMIDAGSTGSRIHVYRFNHCQSRIPDVEHEVFEQIKPGLSAYANSPKRAADSLKPLLEIALQAVPKEFHSCTGIQIKATAGLRLLGADVAKQILSETRQLIRTQYPFPLVDTNEPKQPTVDGDAVAIMDGADEGVFAWVTINSLLDSVRRGGHTAAIMDLGGASTQIVYAPASPKVPDTYRATMSFGGSDHVLYQHSYLGYGLKEALKSIRRFAVEQATHGSPIDHPCYHAGYTTSVDLPQQARTAVIQGKPDAEKCAALVRSALFKTSNATVCDHAPCAFNGVHMPAIPDAAPIFAFSYFYDLLNQVLSVAHAFSESDVPPATGAAASADTPDDDAPASGPAAIPPPPAAASSNKPNADLVRASTTPAELATIQQLACTAPDHLDDNPALAGHAARTVLGDLVHEDPEYCASVTYLGQLLRAYKVPKNRAVTVMKKIRGFEMGWCLGATMAMLDAAERVGGRCRVRT
ncbi:nucleoside phosphatase family-domain-containing protein [Catenaria anguillulae PL171]|uniref:guanosine-diphosphatase n=1 Tax=Catenaria anguillulae PL171 TaxID=765915 RepID=A0A1Y2I0P9_9FUNG|nr:nucleoside phosphatase family-domain-containing protein [Catenaria anguillulae PL171]